MVSSGLLKTINIKPGINKNDSAYQSEGAYVSCDKVRFEHGNPQKIGGWQSVPSSAGYVGMARDSEAWTDLNGERLFAVGSHVGLYVYNGTQFYDITPSGVCAGNVDNGAVTGWGTGTWGGGPWGIGSSSGGVTSQMRQWTLDTWGEDLLANLRNGPIYTWDRTLGVGAPAYAVTGAPTRVNTIAVQSPPRILIAYGCSAYNGNFDPLLVRWSDSEDYNQWTPAVTNASGEIRLQKGNEIKRAVNTRQEIIIFTDEGIYSQTYLGNTDLVFSFDRKGDNCGLIGPHAVVDVNGSLYWMSNSGIFFYNGSVSKLVCTVHDDIFSKSYGRGINFDQADKVFAGVNSEFSEVWWFYPSRNSTENDSYLVYNYEMNLWYQGTMSRTTWTDAGTYDRPIATGVSSDMYYHEIGNDAAGNELSAILDTAYFDIEEGQPMMFVDQFVFDYKDAEGTNSIYFDFKKLPDDVTTFTKGPFFVTPGNFTGKIHFRGKGRQMAVRYACSGIGSYFQIGRNRVRIKPDGDR